MKNQDKTQQKDQVIAMIEEGHRFYEITAKFGLTESDIRELAPSAVICTRCGMIKVFPENVNPGQRFWTSHQFFIRKKVPASHVVLCPSCSAKLREFLKNEDRE